MRIVPSVGSPHRARIAALLVASLWSAHQSAAQPPQVTSVPVAEGKSSEELARAAENPLADMISTPFQNDVNFGVGPNSRLQDVLNLEPIYPFSLGAKAIIITRVIAPLIWQPKPGVETGYTFGLGDILFSAFLGPKAKGNLSWGLGPAILLPTGTIPPPSSQNSGQFCLGPTGAIVYSPGRLVMGLVVNNVFSTVGREGAPSVDALTLQPFFNVNLPKAWFLVTSPIITADWEQPNNAQRWVVPVGGGFGKVQKLGKLPFNLNAQAYWNAVKPDGGGDWTLRLTIAGLFPK
ncbi:MAG: transporter [Polyangia bacterium]